MFLHDSSWNCSLLWNPEVHCCIHNSPPLDPIQSQLNPVHPHLHYLFKIHLTIMLLLLNFKIHYHVHSIPPADPVLSQINPIHSLTRVLFKIHFNIVFPLTYTCYLSRSRFPIKHLYTLSDHHLCYISNPSHPQIWWRRSSQWPRGLRREPYSPARILGSWFWIPLEAWTSVCVYSVFVCR
jgi:hypothetical protein